MRIDTIYLDFAKAFDKVDHNILLKKMIDHKIKGKVGMWIKNFLQDRKYRVVANGVMSEEQEVISGVPQGTVLASILFIIMISDIDEELRNSISRLFADDTKISAKIRTHEDTKLLQKDLDKVCRWADDNLMEFNEKKFEAMSHGDTEGVVAGVHKTGLHNGKRAFTEQTKLYGNETPPMVWIVHYRGSPHSIMHARSCQAVHSEGRSTITLA